MKALKATRDQRLLICAVSIAAAAAYSSWILGYFLNNRVSISSIVSDLSVSSEPFSVVFSTADYIAAILVMAASILGLKYFSSSRRRIWVWSLYGAFGLFTALAAFFHIECSSALVPACHDGSQYYLHVSLGLLANLSLYVAAAMSLLSLPKNLKQWGWVLLVCWLAAGAIPLIYATAIDSAATAIMQRISIVIVTIFIIAVPRITAVKNKSIDNNR